MLTGYNTDVVFEEVTYHVQTEDRGLQTPVLDTLVYYGGQILHQEKISYQDLIDSCPEAEQRERKLAARLDRQHRSFVRRTRHGEFAGQVPAIGELAESGGEFGEALELFIETDDQIEALALTWIPEASGKAGFCGVLTISRVVDGCTAEGAVVTARLIAQGLNPVLLLETTADAEGQIQVALVLPPGSASAVIFSAALESSVGSLRVSLAKEKELSISARGEPVESPVPGSSS